MNKIDDDKKQFKFKTQICVLPILLFYKKTKGQYSF